MRKTLLLAALGMTALVAAPAMAAGQDANPAPAPAPAPSPAAAAAAAADMLQPMLGRTFTGDIILAGARAEGGTLVLVMGGPDGWTNGVTTEAISTAMRTGLCAQAPNFFASGMALRVDNADGENMREGPVVTSCQ